MLYAGRLLTTSFTTPFHLAGSVGFSLRRIFVGHGVTCVTLASRHVVVSRFLRTHTRVPAFFPHLPRALVHCLRHLCYPSITFFFYSMESLGL